MRITTYFLSLFSILFFTHCQTASRAVRISRDIHRSTTEAHRLQRDTHDSIRIQYIGCGGFLIRYGNEGLLIDPYFSNADVLLKLRQPLKSDTALIDNFFVQNVKNTRDLVFQHPSHLGAAGS